jgi:hypothetical protein
LVRGKPPNQKEKKEKRARNGKAGLKKEGKKERKS